MKVVLLGGDLNSYSVAVSFHEAFGVKSAVFCRYKCGITAFSSITELHVEPDFLEDSVGMRVLLDYAKKAGEAPYLIPCGDLYVAFMERNRDRLSKAFRFLIPKHEHFLLASEKADFYAFLEKTKLPYPKSVILEKEDLSLARLLAVGSYPAVLKASNSALYYAHPFPDMQKVYFPKNPKEAMDIAECIFSSGYSGRLVLQECIGTESDPPIAKTLTLFCDTKGKVRRGVLGEVLIEEREGSARGNYAAILSRPPDALTCRLIALLEQMEYEGIANFDILVYKGKSYVLELNPRQGRSCDYLRAAGVSLARFFCEAIEKKEILTDLSSRISLSHAIPLRAIFRRVAPEMKESLHSLQKNGRTLSTFSYRGESLSLRRMMYLPIHALRRTHALSNGR